MSKKMLIDATHKEEVRVAVMEGNRLLEYDYESQSRKPLKGNIFLAKVTRVEPSLQAAFVNYGGNRHGFLPFSEIHPDYFRIPISDREALMAEQEAELEDQDDDDGDTSEDDSDNDDNDDVDELEEVGGEADIEIEDTDFNESGDHKAKKDQSDKDNADEDERFEDANGNIKAADDEDGNNSEGSKDGDQNDRPHNNNRRRNGHYSKRGRRGNGGRNNTRSAHRSRSVETIENDEYEQEMRFRFNLRRKYKI